MKTEKDIRAFVQGHKAVVPGNDGFMDDLVRQMDLLPVPAAFDKVDRQDIQDKLDLVSGAYAALRKRNLRKAVTAAALIIGFCVLVVSAIPFVPEQVLSSCKELLFNISGLAFQDGSGYVTFDGGLSLPLDTQSLWWHALFYGIVGLLCLAFSAIAGKRIFSLK
ncbi:MAG: hypothetical protein NC115_12365 [Bacteroidales bacterium]|nr:hypothetical protein [Bacteroidales bacterium]